MDWETLVRIAVKPGKEECPLMLVLSRREGETIRIEDVLIRINRIRGGRVTVGIEAPKAKRIFRGEIDAESVSTDPVRLVHTREMRRGATTAPNCD